MTIQRLTLKNGAEVSAATILEYAEIRNALDDLEMSHPKSVIVLVGGAGGIDTQDRPLMEKAIRIVAQLAEETGSVLIDGGTQAGVMNEIGLQRKQNNFSFPLIGILPGGKVVQQTLQTVLEPNHTHFILTPGLNWGDESEWIAKTATILAGSEKSITILINGGEVSKKDVDCSLAENRPTIVIRGTGRMADRINMAANLFEVNISQNPDEILSFLKAKLS